MNSDSLKRFVGGKPPRSVARRGAAGRGVVVFVALVGLVAALWGVVSTSRRSDGPLVVYCAHDEIFADAILRDFEKQTGFRVVARYDTEATKSLGLTERILREKDAPRCDVLWNNQLQTTVELARAGVLQSYQGPGWRRIPAAHRDAAGYWVGFAARFRVFILRDDASLFPTELLSRPDAVDDEALAGELREMAVAVPLYGTTLTHYAVLWKEWGPERLKTWHDAVRRHEVRETRGNAMSMRAVAEGTSRIAWTDTDDFFVAKDEGKPVRMEPVRVGGRTIAIPNTAAIVKGTRRRVAAERLVDFLASAETELALAKSRSRQVPLGPVDESQLPDEVRAQRAWAADAYDLNTLGDAHRECLAWLKSLYAP